VDVACPTATAAELGVSFWEAVLEERGWATGCCAFRGLGRSEGVSGATAARMDELAGGGVRLGD